MHLRDLSVRSLDAPEVAIERCAVGRVRGRDVRLNQSGAVFTLGRRVRVRRGGGAVLVGGRLTVEQGGGQWLVGGLVQARQVYAVTVLAARVEGQVRCLFDARGAFALGAGAALVTAVARLFLSRRPRPAPTRVGAGRPAV
jgi:hypothetical protein